MNEYRLLACDIQQLFIAVTIHACSSSGSQYFRVIEDLIVLLGYLQSSKNKRTQNMAVALQLRVLLAALELVRTTARRDPARPAGPPSPSAPHHAAFQKRKSIAGSIPMKGSSVPHLPRRHFRSYGHLPMPFGSLNQDSCPPLCPGSTPCAAPPGAGAVMAQGPQASPPGLRRHSSGNTAVGWNSKRCMCTTSFQGKSLE